MICFKPSQNRRAIICAALIAVFVSTGAHAASAEPIAGRWLTQDKDAIITIGACGSKICGRLAEFLVVPPEGENQRDVNNPDPAKRQRRLKGMAILTELAADKSQWRGRIYDPKSGKTYRSVVKRKNATTLEVKGCVGFLCQTQTWKKAP